MQNVSAEIEKPIVAKREDVCRPKLCNFEYGDAADPFTEDEWKMLTLVHTCQFSGFWTKSLSFSSHRNLRPRRLKSPSFEHRRIFLNLCGIN